MVYSMFRLLAAILKSPERNLKALKVIFNTS
jgi:hypothetical protein